MNIFTENMDKATFHGCMDASCVWIGDTFHNALSHSLARSRYPFLNTSFKFWPIFVTFSMFAREQKGNGGRDAIKNTLKLKFGRFLPKDCCRHATDSIAIAIEQMTKMWKVLLLLCKARDWRSRPVSVPCTQWHVTTIRIFLNACSNAMHIIMCFDFQYNELSGVALCVCVCLR